MNETIQYYITLPLWELTAVFLSIAYIVLAANNNKWCWPAAFFSTLIFAAIFYDVQLLMDSALQLYYLVMAVYGWWCWRQGKKYDDTNIRMEPTDLEISSRSFGFHLQSGIILTLVSFVWGWFMANYTEASFPYLDTFTTVFAVFATYLVTQRVLENWIYWIVIDFVSIYLYISKGLIPTAVLFGLFVVIAFWGYFKWLKMFKANESNFETNSLA